jgi:transcription antitermination factor NusG
LIDVPLFPGYVFARFNAAERRPILQVPGVVSVVAFGNEFISIDDKEIEAIRTILISGHQVAPWPYLRAGQRIRIRSGAMRGVEGLLLEMKSATRIIVSITLLQRSVAAEIDRDIVEPIL